MDLPAKEVIAQAKAKGMTLSVAQVYNIRSTAKLKKSAGAPSGSSSSTSSSRPAAVRVAQRPASDSEARLRRLIAEIGLARSNEILKEVVAVFGG